MLLKKICYNSNCCEIIHCLSSATLTNSELSLCILHKIKLKYSYIKLQKMNYQNAAVEGSNKTTYICSAYKGSAQSFFQHAIVFKEDALFFYLF